MKNRNLQHKDDWATPPDFLAKVAKEYGSFFDPCPWHNNFDTWDGLIGDWQEFNFVNPPYSLKPKEAFVKQALFQKSMYGYKSLFLLPVSTSTKLFHDIIKPNAEKIEFLRGRLRFIGRNDKGQFVNYDQIMITTKETILYDGEEIPKYINALGQQDLFTVLF